MKNKINAKNIPFDIPFGIAGGYYMEFFGGKEAVLTGDFEIIEFEETVLRIKCNERRICFYGNDIKIINYSSDGIRIGGIIKSVDFA